MGKNTRPHEKLLFEKQFSDKKLDNDDKVLTAKTVNSLQRAWATPERANNVSHTSYCTTTTSICSAAHAHITSVSCVNLDHARPTFTGLARTHRRSGPSVSTWAAPCLTASQHHGLPVEKCVSRHSRDRVPRTLPHAGSAGSDSMACPHGLRGTTSRS